MAALLPGTGLSAATEVQVPLVVDRPHLERLLGSALGLDETGRGRLRTDSCNYADLSDLRLEIVDRRLLVDLALLGHSGVMVMGHCRGPGAVSSRLHLELKPAIDAQGMAVVFRADGAELRRPDGSPGLLSRPSRILAESLVIPRLERTTIDVSGVLAAIDDLINEFKPGAGSAEMLLGQRVRLRQVTAQAEGLRTELAIRVRPPPTVAEVPEPALGAEELAEWQRVEDELDGFLTVLIARLASQVDNRDLQLDFLALLLETRQRIAEALLVDDPSEDPVRALFLEAWGGLKPLLTRLEPMDVADDRDLRLAGFIAAGDALAALDALGPEFGLEISRDGLRRLARLLLAGDAPLSFTPLPLVEDPALRRLFGLDPDGPTVGPTIGPAMPALQWWQRLLPLAHANPVSLAESLRGVVASPATLDEYLDLVARLLDAVYTEHMDNGSRIPADYRELFRPLVRATAWRESCWRHYIGPADEPRVIRSSVGAVGMMQIMGRVWSGVYDVQRLEAEIEYNIAAGIEILEHYLVDYAIRRGEHQHPGGIDNLVRATYAAYNGGPRHLSRHRRDDTPASLRAIDESFWNEFVQIREEGWPPVARCFSVAE
ncbi:MAG: lytic transglycosylase domain-containing protein [Wenzhouxiangella sp.]|nr:lytic transglycosylase domain-containing protein [Wenzhouxiangella sp.]